MERKAEINNKYQLIIRDAFELWYIYDKYDEAINRFKEAYELAETKQQEMFCNTNINLIKRNQEADLSDTLRDISNQQEI